MSDKFDLMHKQIQAAMQGGQTFMTIPVSEVLTLLEERDYLFGEVQRLQNQNADLNRAADLGQAKLLREQIQQRQNLPKTLPQDPSLARVRLVPGETRPAFDEPKHVCWDPHCREKHGKR